METTILEKHTVSKLVGSPPGYVGYEEGGQLTEKVRRHPYSVILFDEIEKAHPDVFNMLLQLLDDGRLTDSQGRTVDFRNTIIIIASNIGARLITEKRKDLGFTIDDKNNANAEKIKETVLAELKNVFRPEFLNRVDDTIVFNKLNQEDIEKIAVNLLKGLTHRLKGLDIDISFDESAIKELAKSGFDDVYGARPLKRTITSKVEDTLSERMLDGSVKNGDRIVCRFDGEYKFEKDTKVVEESTE